MSREPFAAMTLEEAVTVLTRVRRMLDASPERIATERAPSPARADEPRTPPSHNAARIAPPRD